MDGVAEGRRDAEVRKLYAEREALSAESLCEAFTTVENSSASCLSTEALLWKDKV